MCGGEIRAPAEGALGAGGPEATAERVNELQVENDLLEIPLSVTDRRISGDGEPALSGATLKF